MCTYAASLGGEEAILFPTSLLYTSFLLCILASKSGSMQANSSPTLLISLSLQTTLHSHSEVCDTSLRRRRVRSDKIVSNWPTSPLGRRYPVLYQSGRSVSLTHNSVTAGLLYFHTSTHRPLSLCVDTIIHSTRRVET